MRFIHRSSSRVIALAAILTLSMSSAVPAAALFDFDKDDEEAPAGAPIAQELEFRAYRNIPYTGSFKAIDREGDSIEYSIVQQPKRGSVEIAEDGVSFIYTPNKNKTGSDRFTYAATDSNGLRSAPAEVEIIITRAPSDLAYADMEGNAAHTAAIDLAARKIFTGSRIGEQYFFEPDRTVSRSEFVAMTMAAAGQTIETVNVTGFADDEQIPLWAKSYAVSALRCGVVEGIGTEHGIVFNANAPISFGEAATVLNRLLMITDVDMEELLADPTTAPWSAQAIANILSVSIVESGSFSGSNAMQPVTRDVCAKMLSAAMTLVENRSTTAWSWLG